MTKAALRAVVGMTFPDIEPGGADMPRPKYAEVDPTELHVDESYQRNLSERSRSLIRRLVASWDWRAFKPPNVVRVGKVLHVIDGQHTAIAAASHPMVGKIPVLIVDAPAPADRAAAFVKLNRDRIAVTPTQLHYALVEAGDEDAVTVRQVCERAGVRVLRYMTGNRTYLPGDTMSIGAIAALVSRRGAMGGRRVLEICTKAKLAPILMAPIRAVEALLFDAEHKAEGYHAEDIVTALRADHDRLRARAESLHISLKVPTWKAFTTLLSAAVREVRDEHRTAA